MSGGRFKARPQAAQQQSQVCALGTIKSMQLIHHEIAQGRGRVALPELAVFGAQQQVVQHFVVGQQNIRRVFAQGFAVGNHVGGRHHHALPWIRH